MPVEIATSVTDGELLAAFAQRDEEAMAELIQRHGRMVLRTCQRLLGVGEQAEQVAQAVFVALARNAGRLRNESCLAAWLHRQAVLLARPQR